MPISVDLYNKWLAFNKAKESQDYTAPAGSIAGFEAPEPTELTPAKELKAESQTMKEAKQADIEQQKAADVKYDQASMKLDEYKKINDNRVSMGLKPIEVPQDVSKLALESQQQKPMQLGLAPNAEAAITNVVPGQPPKMAGDFNQINMAKQDVFQDQKNAILGGQQAQDDYTKALNGQYTQTQKSLTDLQDNENIFAAHKQEQIDNHMAKLDQMVQDYGSKKIDPNNYWNNLGTGGKIMASIGLVLGGKASADILMKHIDNDINSQKADLAVQGDKISQKKGLIGELTRQLGDQRAATAAAKAIYLQKAGLDIQRLATNASSSQAKMNAQVALSQLELQQKQYAMEYTKAMQLNSMTGNEDGLMRKVLLLPKEEQGAAIKELGVLKQKTSILNNLDQQMDQMHKSESVGGGLLSSIGYHTESQKQAEAIEAALITTIQQNSKTKLNETGLREVIKPLLPKPLDDPKTLQNKKEQMKALVSRSFTETPILSGYGIDKDITPTKNETIFPGLMKGRQ